MDLQVKLDEAQKAYKQIVEKVQKIDLERSQLINEGVKLEGRIILLQEQLHETASVSNDKNQ